MLKKQVLKKAVAWLLLVCMLCSFAPVSAFAANETSTVTITNSSSGSTDGASTTTGTSGSGNGGMPILPVVTYVEVGTYDALASALATGKSVRLTADITMPEGAGAAAVTIPATADKVVVDLAGHTLTASARTDATDRTQYAFDNLANLTVVGKGKIVARGIQNHGTLTVFDGVTVEACDTNGGGCVWGYDGSKTVLSDVTFVSARYGVCDSDPWRKRNHRKRDR